MERVNEVTELTDEHLDCVSGGWSPDYLTCVSGGPGGVTSSDGWPDGTSQNLWAWHEAARTG